MIRKLFLIILFLLTITTTVLADEVCESSGIKTTDGLVTAGYGEVCGVVGTTNGSDELTCLIYDNANSASGTALLPPIKVAGTDLLGGVVLSKGVRFRNGIYLDVTNPGYCVILYRK